MPRFCPPPVGREGGQGARGLARPTKKGLQLFRVKESAGFLPPPPQILREPHFPEHGGLTGETGTVPTRWHDPRTPCDLTIGLGF